MTQRPEDISQAEAINGKIMPDCIWLMDMGGHLVWCEDPDPDGEQADSVKYVRARFAHTPAGVPREATAEMDNVRESLRVTMLDQVNTGRRETYSDGFAQGLCEAIRRIDAALDAAPQSEGVGDEWSEAIELAASIADKWAAENKAAAAKARRSPNKAVNGMEEMLDGAAIECNAIAAEIRKLSRSAPVGQREGVIEAGREAYFAGFSDGFVDRSVGENGFPDEEEEKIICGAIEPVSIAEGWRAYEDTFLRALAASTGSVGRD